MAITKQHMHIITSLSSGQGIEQGGWRWPTEDKTGFINEDVFIKGAQLAEKGKLNGLFITDTPITIDLRQPPHSSLDPAVLLALMGKATERIGLIPTLSTTLNEPYSIARTRPGDQRPHRLVSVKFATSLPVRSPIAFRNAPYTIDPWLLQKKR